MNQPETLDEARQADRISRRKRWLADAETSRRHQEQVIANLVAGLRRDGVSWAAIGEILGVSRQAAEQRFGKKS